MDRVIKVSRGVKGERGVSITNVELNLEGHFIVYYDNGEVVDTGLSAFGTAKQYSDKAQASQEAAKTSEDNAKASETEAAKQAEVATQQAKTAASESASASQSATNAENSATASATSADDSAKSANTASEAKAYIESHYDEIKQDMATTETQIDTVKDFLSQTDSHMKAVEADLDASKQAVTDAQGKVTEASTYAEQASSSAAKAESYETSASTYASQAQKSADAAAKSATEAADSVKNVVLTEDNLDDTVKGKLLGDKNVTADNIKDGTITVDKLAFSINTSESGGTVTTVPWTNITGKPDTYTPSAHTHKIADISDLDLSTYATAEALNGKQDKLTFDDTPTADSTNPVTSAGVKKYVDDALSAITDADSKSY